ncbi:MAG: hypothetical protein ACOY4K_14720 [Pseudomonadota bacterium]
MTETLANLPPVHLAYLIAATGAFCLFGLTLAVVSIRTNLTR